LGVDGGDEPGARRAPLVEGIHAARFGAVLKGQEGVSAQGLERLADQTGAAILAALLWLRGGGAGGGGQQSGGEE
jgi:hypothetical protein